MKHLLHLLFLIFSLNMAKGQFCGTTDLQPCIPPVPAQQAGFNPPSMFQPPFINGQLYNTVIGFLCPDTLQGFSVQNFTLDSIMNLPFGVCWTTDKPNNRFTPGQYGCLLIKGTPCDSTGQYNLKIMADITVLVAGIQITHRGAVLGGAGDTAPLMPYYFRLINYGEPVSAVDTNQCRENIEFSPSGIASACNLNGVSNMEESNIRTVVSPDPLTDKAQLSVKGLSTGFTFELYELTGRLIHQQQSGGVTELQIERNGLAPGIYIYHITVNSKHVATGKLVVQ